MKTKALFTALTLSACLALPTLGQAQSSDEVNGEVLIPLNYVAGLKSDGSLDPSTTKNCEDTYKDYIGKEVFVDYQITKTQNKAAALIHDVSVPLSPLGIPETYSFASDKMPQALLDRGIDRVIFTMEDDFDDEVIHIIAKGVKDDEKCFLSTEAFAMRQ